MMTNDDDGGDFDDDDDNDDEDDDDGDGDGDGDGDCDRDCDGDGDGDGDAAVLLRRAEGEMKRLPRFQPFPRSEITTNKTPSTLASGNTSNLWSSCCRDNRRCLRDISRVGCCR